MSVIIRCEYDSGSMYGNRPACDTFASYDVTYRNGSFSSLTIAVCTAHLPNIEARIYPSRTVIEHCTQPWER